MIHQRVNLQKIDWVVDIFYDTRPQDADEMIDRLWDMGCAERYLRKAYKLLKSGVPNEGLTYSNPYERRSLIVIGHTNDCFQFINSLSHEKQHIEQAICRADNLDPYGEDIAYISGDISQALARNAWATMRRLFLYLI